MGEREGLRGADPILHRRMDFLKRQALLHAFVLGASLCLVSCEFVECVQQIVDVNVCAERVKIEMLLQDIGRVRGREV